MRRLALLFLHGVSLVVASNMAYGDSCMGIRDDRGRLDCFDRAHACTNISRSDARLECYDEVYSNSPQAPVAPVESKETLQRETPEPSMPPKANEKLSADVPIEVPEKAESGQKPAVVERADDGFGKKKKISAPAAFIEGEIVEVMQNARKIDYVILDNGHIWREYEDYRIRYKVGQKVRIEEGILGSYNMKINGVKKLIKVKRVDE